MIPIPPFYQITPEMVELIAKIDANLIYFLSIKLPDLLKNKIQRTSILKSSLFSARIEGNTLTYERINNEDSETDEKKEIFNILKAVEFLDHNIGFSAKITPKIILNLHSLVMRGRKEKGNFFRTDPSAIFNTAGVAVYITPSPKKLPGLIKQMLKYSNSKNENFPLINAFVSHLIFEKIHPFIDGNGRIGRLLIYTISKSKKKDSSFFIPFEEYLDEHKSEYYYYLDDGLENTNDYLVFMLQAFYEQTEKVKQAVEEEMGKDQLLLTPRQEEVYNIIRDHKIVSFDEIKRRFLKVPPRTLSYNLKKLINKKLVIKIGETKGTYYKVG